MLAKILSGTLSGIEGKLIEVEVDVANRGFPTFTIVGLPSKSVDEAKDRVKTAIINASFEMPDSRITVNLAPADIPKKGSGFDLPIAVGILAASGIIRKDVLNDSLFIGELSLEGKVRLVPGALSIVQMAKEKRISQVFVPLENACETVLVDGITVYPLSNLLDLILYLNGHTMITPQKKVNINEVTKEEYSVDFCDIHGQKQAKRGLEIAAAGFHNIHLKGPPGTGKTLLSRAFPSVLPPMNKAEILEVTKIYSSVGLLNKGAFITIRPFRSPHNTVSRIGLIGGGTNPTPGEISLAHRGVLFLDEFPEFPHSVLEALRQPMEDGRVTVSRASGSMTFPSRFILLAASNPCPCGYFGHPKKSCSCLPGAMMKYRKRLSGPLLDRIDLHVDVPPVQENQFAVVGDKEETKKIRERIMKAHIIQNNRFKNTKKIHSNGEMGVRDIKAYCNLTKEAMLLLRQAVSRLSLSARSYFKIIKVAQTITDLQGEKTIDIGHIGEALQFRLNDE